MARLETDRRKIVKRPEGDGWRNTGGRRHDIYVHDDNDHHIAVPRHSPLTPGVARQIGKAARWKRS